MSKTDRKSQTINYVYDALNRLTHKGYPDSTGVDYIYDLVGKIRQVTDPTGTYGFAYDNMGRLIGTTTQYTFIPNQTYSNTYTYDAASNRTGLTAPDSSTTTYGYDALNRLTDQTNSWAGHFSFGYDELSRRTSLTRPNGINTSYSYDNLSHLMSVLHQQGTTNVDGATYTYDNAGNRLSKQNLLNSTTEHYDYDAIYQLKHVIQDLSGGGQTTTESYTYDQVGNRLSALNVATYSYDSSNHLNSSSDGLTYTYDNNGNTLTKTDASGTTQYAWDFENRLTSVTLPGSGGVVTFKYNPFDRRIQKSSTAGTTNYVYDGANIVAELSPAGIVNAKYAQGKGIDHPLAMSRGGVTALYNGDGLDSITSLYDSAGMQAATYAFTSFGNTTSTGTPLNPFQYTGRERDDETGLYYYRARYYEPATGKFLTEDPIGFKGGDANRYRYVHNTPTILKDPSGLKVYRCKRKAIVSLFGFNLNIFGFTHHWLKTDTVEAGLGPAGGGIPGVPGQPGAQGTPSDFIGEPTTINDHSGASTLSGVVCEEIEDVDEKCVNHHLEIGSYQGPFGIPHTNNCQAFAGNILDVCSTKPKPQAEELSIDEKIRLRGPLFP